MNGLQIKENQMFMNTEVVNKILKNNSGKILTIRFIKRSNKQERVLNGIIGVSKYVSGVGMNYKPEEYNLFTIYDLQAASKLKENEKSKAYRCVPIDSVLEIKSGGNSYNGVE